MRSATRWPLLLLLCLALTASPVSRSVAQEDPAPVENGDVNGDGSRDLTDVLYLLRWLFQSGPEPAAILADAEDQEALMESVQNGDIDGNGTRDLSDAVRLLNYLYSGGGAALPPIDLYDCSGARQATLKKHLPRIVSHAGTDALTLCTVLGDGLGRKTFAQASGWGKYWTHNLNPTTAAPADWGKSMPLTSGFENAASVAFGSFAFNDGGIFKAGVPYLDGALPPRSYHFQSTPSLSQSFNGFYYPRTVVSTADGSRVNFFGIQDADGQASLSALRYPLIRCEASWNPVTQTVPSANGGVQFRFTDHGLPTLAGAQPFGVEPGPNSACSMMMRRPAQAAAMLHHFVFVTARFLSQTALFDKVTYLELDGANWNWGADLGSPVPNAEILDGPLAYTYKNGAGRYNMSVWVVARDRNSGDRNFRLYEKFFVDAGNDNPVSSYFTGWTNHGFPSGSINGGAWPAGTKFHLTTGMTWGLATGLRNNLFGWAEGYTDPNTGASVKKQLIEHYFDNATWQWGMILSPPDGLEFRTESSAVVETPTYRRLSLVGRSGSGAIWELAYTFTNGVDYGWFWTELSCEPALRVIPRL